MYSLVYSYGTHNIQVVVSSDDFYRVINDLSEEFTIVKEESFCGDYLFYYLINYLGDLDFIGSVALK